MTGAALAALAQQCEQQIDWPAAVVLIVFVVAVAAVLIALVRS